MLSGVELMNLRRLAEKYGLDSESYIDPTLDYYENKRNLLRKVSRGNGMGLDYDGWKHYYFSELGKRKKKKICKNCGYQYVRRIRFKGKLVCPICLSPQP